MARIERIAIAAHGRIVTALLDTLFGTGMAAVAEALQLAKDEAVLIAVVWNNVISTRGGRGHAALQAHGAQWVMHELQPRPSTPVLRAVEAAHRFSPRRRSVQPRICVALGVDGDIDCPQTCKIGPKAAQLAAHFVTKLIKSVTELVGQRIELTFYLRVRVTTAQEISCLYGTQSGHVQLMRSRTLSSAIAATTRSIVSAAEAYCAADVTSSKSGASRGEPTDSQPVGWNQDDTTCRDRRPHLQGRNGRERGRLHDVGLGSS
jgi:hypothetical protein